MTKRPMRPRRVPPEATRLVQRLKLKSGRLSYEEAWLKPLQRLRRAELGPDAEGPPRLLVRVDEFPIANGLDQPRFGRRASERFHDVMAAAGVQHLVAIVPQWTHDYLNPDAAGGRPLGDEDIAFLDRMRVDGVTFGQHGTTHRTRFAKPRQHSELSGLRPDELGMLIDSGRRALAGAGVRPRVFVPPFNRFDPGQWATLESRFDVVTGGPESVLCLGFHGGPQWRGDAVYLPCYPPLYGAASQVLPAVKAALATGIGTWLPVVLHPSWELADDFTALRRLATVLAPYAVSWDVFLDEVDASRRVT
ncbi:MAG: DUF2334 domain-containing protein [Thermoleophilia bacterium]